MPELLLELFSEEIPARMQARAAADLERLVTEALAALSPSHAQAFAAPRRIALTMQVQASIPATQIAERGPRISAPPAALDGFLRKHGATRDDVRQENDYWVLEKNNPAVLAHEAIATAMPGLLRRFPWPKSMRWGNSAFTWVRPLRRIVCLLDGVVVPFHLADADDQAHGLCSGAWTEGHRFMAPGAFDVTSAADWQAKLRAHCVMLDATERRTAIEQGVAALAAAQNLQVVADPGLLDEVAGLVEWPVPLLGRIDDAHMDLPPEVMQVSMRVNQRYFALRMPDGAAAPFFAFAANIEAPDQGATIVAGNERVLRARFADARHFWDLDRKTPLVDRVEALRSVTFHAKLGTQYARTQRLVRLAGVIAGLLGADVALAQRAAWLAKADLTTGMVGEFPELQGVMGGYYARHDAEDARVADAVRDHYLPRGAGDAVPTEPVAISVALADRLDQLANFFAVGEKPTGSGDPFALRRAALGVIRIIRENGLRLNLRPLLAQAGEEGLAPPMAELMDFLAERLRVQLRSEGARHDVLSAVFAAHEDDDLNRVLARTDAVAALLGTQGGADLLAAYKRAANILRIEEKKDGLIYTAFPEQTRLQALEERDLHRVLLDARTKIDRLLEQEDFMTAMSAMAVLRDPLDRFFENVSVNAPEAELRENRLCLLHQIRQTMNRAADFSRIEG